MWMTLARARPDDEPERPAPHSVRFARARGTMSEAQWLDYKAACEGRISWARYFQLWGNGPT